MEAWSHIEVELIVRDYFAMLQKELSDQPYSKAAHRRALLPFLSNRSEGSIEFKHQNISAVLIKLGQPYIKGYLPRFNIQLLLIEKVVHYLETHPELERLFQMFADNQVISGPTPMDFKKLLVEPPKTSEPKLLVSEPELFYKNNPIKINYLEREQQNTKLGELGEELVLNYERWSLQNIGKENLADRIEWVSKENDRAGFDILSYHPDGTDKYIEVKTTKLGKETPFFFSKSELNFSMQHATAYHLFRLFNFHADVKIFTKQGSLNKICQSEAVSYKGWF